MWQLDPHEIQLGILKRLPGTPISRHTAHFDMRYNPDPPYNVLSTSTIDFATLQMFSRFARYWDLIANSGRFGQSLALIMASAAPFDAFYTVSESVFAQCGQTHRIALRKLFDYLYIAMTEALAIEPTLALAALEQDFASSGQKGRFLVPTPASCTPYDDHDSSTGKARRRQSRHLQSAG